jgi:lysophospholipase L1-like esterase
MIGKILFIGDSVTDCDRVREDLYDTGSGYVKKLVDAHFADDLIINKGISGDRIGNLEDRWQEDVMDLQPSVLTILIGVNDTWRRYDDNDPTSAEDFTNRYRALIQKTQAAFPVKIILCEPFILAVRDEMKEWRTDLEEKIAGIKSLANEFNLPFVAYDQKFAELVPVHGMGALAEDGIHPTDFGHQVMADLWLETFKALP